MIDARRMLSDGLQGTILSIDWISTTRRWDNRDHVVHPSLYDGENWDNCNGVNGYTTGAKHTTGVKTYSHAARPDMGKHSIYSGSALRRVEEYNGTQSYDILNHHISSGDSLTRIDLAVDFVNKGVKGQDFERAFMKGEVDTRIKSASRIDKLTGDGYSLYLGSRKKIKKLVNIYDKAAEQNIPSADWLRVETRIMGKPATQAGRLIDSRDDKGTALIEVVRGVADYPTVPQWRDLTMNVGTAEIGSITSEKGDTRQWLINQCVPALAKEIALDKGFADVFNDAVIAKLVELSAYAD